MPRKQESILNTLADVPWWVSVLLAMSIYIILKFIIPSIQFENYVINSFLKAMAQIAHLIAFVLFIPAPISAYNAFRKRALLEKQKDIDTIKNLSWKEFEELVAEAYRRQGYSVIENNDYGPDGGIDLVLKKGGNIYFVQCKQWRSANVGVKTVREMLGIMTDKRVDGIILVTSGMFTQEAKNFAIGKSIDLVEGQQLSNLINKVKTSNFPKTEKVREKEAPTCPGCGSEMVLRVAKKGKYSGKQFWGCSAFPKCRKTINFEGDHQS